MEEKRYPVFDEEEGIGKCCEPAVGYAATGSGYAYTLANDDDMLPDDYDPGIGPYTMEELYSRVAESEEQFAKGNYITSEELFSELDKEFHFLEK